VAPLAQELAPARLVARLTQLVLARLVMRPGLESRIARQAAERPSSSRIARRPGAEKKEVADGPSSLPV